MIIWRLNRVPDKTFIKFLDLVGVDLHAPSPARAELTFQITAGANPDVAYPIPKGTQVTLGASGGPPVIFETDDNLHGVVSLIKAVQVYDSARFRLYPVENFAPPSPVPALSPEPQDGCVFAVGFDVRFPEAAELRMLVHVAGRTPVAAVQARGTGRDTFAAPVQAVWEYSTGDAARWAPLAVASDDSRFLTRTGAIVFAGPPKDDFKAMPYGLRNKPGEELFWIRFRVESVLGSGYETPPVVEDVLLNTITATNAVTVRREVLGASNGLPNQQFQLANSPILPMPAGATGRVEIREEEDGGYELWTEVRDFDGSAREDKHYVLDASAGIVRFGDGKHGKIPRALTLAAGTDPQAFERNTRITEYRWGGGARGNAGANKITGLQSSVAFVDRVTNLRPSVGGQDEESLDEAKLRAPMTIRTMSRAVTPEDFAFLAQQTPGALIRRAQAFPLLNPSQRVRRAGDGSTSPELPLPGVVTVVVVPESTNPRPTPSGDTLKLVADWLDSHRLLTTELYVAAPRYRQVHIRAQVLASPSADSGVVERELRQRLLDYFHPLRGGRRSSGWDFGQTIDFSETYGHILNTPGVVSIRTDSFQTFVDDEAVPACTDVPLEPDELVYSVDHEIEVSYA